MALRSFATTRMMVVNCVFRAFGGDTVSPWNDTAGMYYFKDCRMEGGVDFYCPRGWAYAEGCEFVAHTGTAACLARWFKKQIFQNVFKNCSFSGYKGFKLARYHRDAQFFFVDCSFSGDMSDTDIYLVPTSNIIQWGAEYIFTIVIVPGRLYLA
jgi:pectinesterase